MGKGKKKRGVWTHDPGAWAKIPEEAVERAMREELEVRASARRAGRGLGLPGVWIDEWAEGVGEKKPGVREAIMEAGKSDKSKITMKDGVMSIIADGKVIYTSSAGPVPDMAKLASGSITAGEIRASGGWMSPDASAREAAEAEADEMWDDGLKHGCVVRVVGDERFDPEIMHVIINFVDGPGGVSSLATVARLGGHPVKFVKPSPATSPRDMPGVALVSRADVREISLAGVLEQLEDMVVSHESMQKLDKVLTAHQDSGEGAPVLWDGEAWRLLAAFVPQHASRTRPQHASRIRASDGTDDEKPEPPVAPKYIKDPELPF